MATDNTSIPSGFDISVGRAQGDGWFVKAENAILHGRLLGRYELGSGDDERFFYQVKLSHGCKATTGKGADAKEIDLKEGQIVNIGEHKALEDLKKYADNGGVYDVFIKYGALQKIPSGTFWPLLDGTPRLKQIKAPPAKSDIPF